MFIYIYHIIPHNQSSVNHRITSQGLHSTKQYTNRHTNRKLHIIELSRKITKQKFHTQHAIRVSLCIIRIHTRFNTLHTRIIRNPPEHKIACKPSHTRISSPYAYHQSYFPRSKIPYAYQPCHTRITRIIFLFNYSHTRMSILIRSHTQHTSTWFLGQGNCVSYAYSPLGVSPIRVSASCHTRMALFHTRKTRKRPVTCRIRHRPRPIRSHSYQSTKLSPKTRKNASNNVRIHPQTIAYDSLTNSIHHILIYQLLGITVQTPMMNTDECFRI